MTKIKGKYVDKGHDRTVAETSFGEKYFLEDGIIGEHALVSLVCQEGERVVTLDRDDIAAMLAKMDGGVNERDN